MIGAIISFFALSFLGGLSVAYRRVVRPSLNFNRDSQYSMPAKILAGLGSYYGLYTMFQSLFQMPDALDDGRK